MCFGSILHLTTVHAADPNLGRVDLHSFSDQILMEMLFEGFDDESKTAYQDADGTYLDVCKWPCIECDADKRVAVVKLVGNISGHVQASYIPPKVKALYLPRKKLRGTIDLAQLPRGMENLCFFSNQLEGSIDLTQLPERMEKLALSSNQLIGTLDLTALPPAMRLLFLDYNRFTGCVDLMRLPKCMAILSFGNNRLSGSFVAMHLPPDLQKIVAKGNNFSDVAVVDSTTRAEIEFGGSGVTSVVDESGNPIVSEVRF